MCFNYKLLCTSKASATIQRLCSRSKAPLHLTRMLSVQLRSLQPQPPSNAGPSQRHGPRWLQPWLGTVRTCHLRLACRNAHPEHLSPATSCNKGSLWTPSSLPHSNPTVCNPSFNLNDRFNTRRQKSLQSSSNSMPVNSHKQESSSTFGACFLYVLMV